MKKVSFIIGTLLGGGAERVVTEISNKLCSEYEITIILLLNQEKKDYKVNEMIKVIELPKFKSKKDMLIGIPRKLSTIMKELDSDIYISFCTLENTMSLLANISARKKLYISERNAPSMEHNNYLIKILRKLLYKRAYGYVFQTTDAMKYYSHSIQQRSVVIPNPVKPGLPHFKFNNSKTICAVGRLNEQKNYPLLINSFKDFLVDCPDYKLNIFGKGILEESLLNLINELNLKESVELKGFSKNIHNDIKEMEFYVMSSDYEGMPNALMEAMAMGLPCISSDCPSGGPKELINDYQNGILFKTGDKKELSSKMKELANNEELRRKISCEAQKISIEYDIDKIVEKWRGFINERVEREK